MLRSSQFFHLATILALAFFLAPAVHAQVRPSKSGSADAKAKIDAQKDKFAAGQPGKPGYLTLAGLKVGAQGRPERMEMKVVQVIDDKQMIVGLEDSRTNTGRYGTWVMMKGFPTAGITDGKFIGSDWDSVIGKDQIKVTGTTTYKTVLGGSKTVFVIEPGEPVKVEAAPAKSATTTTYDDQPEPLRSQPIKDWETQRDLLRKAIKDGKARLGRTREVNEKRAISAQIKMYTDLLAQHEKNDPPYRAKN